MLLENLLRFEDDRTVKRDDVEALLKWDPAGEPDREIAFRPARVLLQDFTGVPCVVDLAAMRDAIKQLGGDPHRINPRPRSSNPNSPSLIGKGPEARSFHPPPA